VKPQEITVSSSDLVELNNTIPLIKEQLAQVKHALDTCSHYQYALIISRVVRAVQKVCFFIYEYLGKNWMCKIVNSCLVFERKK
jgi:hypothetical protein